MFQVLPIVKQGDKVSDNVTSDLCRIEHPDYFLLAPESGLLKRH
jgi:hypothetical protein